MSPTVLRTLNLRIVIIPGDHPPPHVHVIGPDSEAKFDIETSECIENYGLTQKSLWRVQSFIQLNQRKLLEVWYENQTK